MVVAYLNNNLQPNC